MMVDKFPDRMITVDGKNYIYFGGTSYLGMASHPEFQKLLFEAINNWGTAYGSSRNANIKLSVYEKVESALARSIGTEKVLSLSSGTLAGQLVLAYLSLRKLKFYHYPKTHPAIIQKNSQPLFLQGHINAELINHVPETVVICADAIISGEIHPTDFKFLNDISLTKKVILIIDESHSLGIVGDEGFGIYNQIIHPIIHQKLIVSSLTKAYGCTGGIIGGSKELIEAFQTHPLFVSASGMNPIFLDALFNAQNLFQIQLHILRDNMAYLAQNFSWNLPFVFNPKYPVIYCTDNRIYDYLKSEGIVITNFKYPNYDIKMNRIVITAQHTHADLDQLINSLKKFKNLKEH